MKAQWMASLALLFGHQTQARAPAAAPAEGEMTLALALATPAQPGHSSEVFLGFDNTSVVPYHVAKVESPAAEGARILHADGSRSAGFIVPARRFFVTGLGFQRLQLEGVRRPLAPGDTITITLIGPHGRLNVEVRVREFATDPSSGSTPKTLRTPT